ncbi:hypothetical protein O181_011133 [Austropuccinia psidii MF-1]|uniref:Tet-like 2OG-Fe(II) oxygenase domain-containing protein n=1 Tax=Austropuccinia psidii MF-1 TaxID=1389203 RepID=A0A9Q3BUP5_9BASI|nr:hypothetical protein [Austropuccinia psidii MF-1]
MNVFKNSPQLDRDASLYSPGWWFQADKQTGQTQRDASKWCTGEKLIFPNENSWIDISSCHGLIQVVWASSAFVHYTDPAQDSKSTTLVGSQHFTRKFLCLSRIPTLHTQILTPVQDPNTSHAKPCAVNPYTGSSSQQCQHPENSDISLCQCRLPTLHIQILTLCRFPTIQAIPYAGAGFQQFTHKFLCLYRL